MVQLLALLEPRLPLMQLHMPTLSVTAEFFNSNMQPSMLLCISVINVCLMESV